MAIGHRLLIATPEARTESQPAVDHESACCIVFDGRLDNRAELIAELSPGAHTTTDVELVLLAYRRWRDAAPERLLGDFAFAAWDARNQTLFCARDHLGARPLYFARTSAYFAFASEDDALARLSEVGNAPNEELIAHLLCPAFTEFDPRRSWIADVSMLLPGESCTVTANGALRVRKWWTLELDEEDSYASDADCEDAFRDVFSRAVRDRLRVSGQPGAMVSGGIDSAAIVAFAAAHGDAATGCIASYSAVADEDSACIETRCIRSVIANARLTPHLVAVPNVTGNVGFEDLRRFVWDKPHPIDNEIPLPATMCMAASRDGMRVLLVGTCGDLAMYESDRYITHVLRSSGARAAWAESCAASRNHHYLRGQSPAKLLALAAWTAYAPVTVREQVHRARQDDAETPRIDLLSADFVARIGLRERLRGQSARRRRDGRPGDRRDRWMFLSGTNIASGLTGFGRVAGRLGIELRDPWADLRVVKFFLGLPLRQNVRDGWNKSLVRRALAGRVPDSVRWRRGKEHLGWLLTRRLMLDSSGELERSRDAALSWLTPYVDQQHISRAFLRCNALAGNEEIEEAYLLATLARWLENRADARTLC